MSKNSHTPGPWTLETVRTQCGICHKIGPFPWKNGEQNSACIYVDYASNGAIEKELEANANLIAAAPDLLEALLDVRRALELANFTGELAVVDAAITKAKGESQ